MNFSDTSSLLMAILAELVSLFELYFRFSCEDTVSSESGHVASFCGLKVCLRSVLLTVIGSW